MDLHAATRGVLAEAITIDGTPATVFRAAGGTQAPTVVSAHGLARYAALGIGWPLDTFVTSFVPGPGRGAAWAHRRTGHPRPAGIANAVAFAWAIGVTFPRLAG